MFPPHSSSINIPLGTAEHLLTLAISSPGDISMRWGTFAESTLESAGTGITR